MSQTKISQQFKIFILVIKMNTFVLCAKKSQWLSFLLFAIVLLFLFPFAFGTDLISQYQVQIGCYWIIQEFLAALFIPSILKLEHSHGVLDIYHGSQNSKMAFFWGKVCFTTLYFLSLQIPIFILWCIFFNFHHDLSILLFKRIFILNLLFSFTASMLGAFLYAVTRGNHLKEVVQSLLFFPLQSASLLAVIGLCLDIYTSQNSSYSLWWNVVLLYPILFIGLSLLFGDTLHEE